MTEMSEMSQSQLEWFDDLSRRYMKHNVSLYKLTKENKGDLGKIDFNMKILKKGDYGVSLKVEDKEYDLSLSSSSSFRSSFLKEIKENLIEFLKENHHIRVAILSEFNENEIVLLSTYNEEGEKLSNYMYDDFIWSLYYTIRFPQLDFEGYYILSGMVSGFDTFKDKYNMDVCIFPLDEKLKKH